MKKAFAIIIALALLLLSSCSGGGSADAESRSIIEATRYEKMLSFEGGFMVSYIVRDLQNTEASCNGKINARLSGDTVEFNHLVDYTNKTFSHTYYSNSPDDDNIYTLTEEGSTVSGGAKSAIGNLLKESLFGYELYKVVTTEISEDGTVYNLELYDPDTDELAGKDILTVEKTDSGLKVTHAECRRFDGDEMILGESFTIDYYSNVKMDYTPKTQSK